MSSLRLFTLLVAVFVAPVLSQSCTGRRVYSTCGSPCTLTCENHDSPPICLTSCATGCFCPSGTVLHNDQCIDPSECPGDTPTTSVVPTENVCTNGKVFNLCGTACPWTCDNYQNPPVCGLQCHQGCFCPSPLVELGDRCVNASQCPNTATSAPTTPPPPPSCINGKIFETCGTACPRTCDNYQHDFLPCTLQCVTGCFCPAGLVQRGDECVTTSECAGDTPTTSVVPTENVCTNGKVFNLCGTACPWTCDNYQNPPVCGLQCHQGCFCPSPLVELGDRCVNASQCPNTATSAPTTPPPPPSCINGKIFETCGTACPRTCDNYQRDFLPCTLQCVTGCFCPAGLVQRGDDCVTPSECAATDAPTTPVMPTENVCTNGKVFNLCGTACPWTCDNYQNPPVCGLQCHQGCFCPSPLVELGDRCVNASQCPNTATSAPTTPPPPPSCINGKIFETCGTACPRTCDNYQRDFLPCTLQCVTGCFCPAGLVQRGDDCVTPSECAGDTPTTSVVTTENVCTNGKVFNLCGTACPWTCDNYRNPPVCGLQCHQGCFCPSPLVELGDRCVNPRECPNPEPTQPTCSMGKVYKECGTACPLTCANRDNPPVCTRQCVAGCFCPAGTMEDENGRCVQESECPERECPDGMEYRECGPVCPYTCKSYLGLDPCFSLRCASAGCFCPVDHVTVDGQCIPAALACRDTRPTTEVNKPSPAILKMKIRNTLRDEFMNQQENFLDNIRGVLTRRGYGEVHTAIYSISEDEHLVVVIQLRGDSISSAQAEELANVLSEESGTFTLEIVEVTVNDENDDDSKVLSDPVIVGIAVGSSVLGLILILLLSAILVMCFVNRRSKYKQTKRREKMELSSKMPAAQHDFAKDKLVSESLSY